MLKHPDGRTQTIHAWALETGIPAGNLRERIRKGWPMAEVLSMPLRPYPYRRRRKA